MEGFEASLQEPCVKIPSILHQNPLDNVGTSLVVLVLKMEASIIYCGGYVVGRLLNDLLQKLSGSVGRPAVELEVQPAQAQG